MAFNDKDQVVHQQDGGDSRHSSLGDGSIRSSGHKGACEKDELAISQRGNIPPRGSHAAATAAAKMMSIEDQLNQLSAEEEKSWKYQDSVHRNSSHHQMFGAQYFDQNNKNGISDGSIAFDDSCASFDTFGGGDNDVGDMSDADLLEDQKAAFCNLEPEMTPRRTILSTRTPSSRLIRSSSSRASSALQLIQEDDL
ncbi:hypothetical protein ACA910_012586 [Epithemia clementina (nom. ined.)]